MFSRKKKQEYNMYTDPGEAFYYREYMHHLAPVIPPRSRVLDIGAQAGRFAVPFAQAGHTVTATDIDSKHFDSIRQQAHPASIELIKEDIHSTIKRIASPGFDVILCLEILYTLNDFPSILQQLRALLNKGGVLITSHRSKGYYIYRSIAERKFAELEDILSSRHAYFNCQDTNEIRSIYSRAGYTINKMAGIGIFSGIGNDPFAAIANPSVLSQNEQEQLLALEIAAQQNELFINNSRYILVTATPA
jgi:2-polyprenyl-3-methyl-5-hydroxy-6-metoxy-1,4-benzoquinol methylase